MDEREIIKEEEWQLERIEAELKKIRGKWIKMPSTSKFIEFLEQYCKEKEKFIKDLEKRREEIKGK